MEGAKEEGRGGRKWKGEKREGEKRDNEIF